MAFAREVADKVIFMHQGQVWEQGTASMLSAPATPELRQAPHKFIQLEKLHDFLVEWTQQGTHLQPEIANYLKGHGWTRDQTWGREVRVTRAARERKRGFPNT